jgi:hypothetical protein
MLLYGAETIEKSYVGGNPGVPPSPGPLPPAAKEMNVCEEVIFGVRRLQGGLPIKEIKYEPASLWSGNHSGNLMPRRCPGDVTTLRDCCQVTAF